MSASGNNIGDFISKLEKFKDMWASVETRVMIARVEDHWINLATIIKLSFEEEKEKEKELFQLENHLKIIQKVERFNFEDLRIILKNLPKAIKIGNIDIISEGTGDFHYIRKEKENWKEGRLPEPNQWPAYLLRCYGKHPRELIKNIDEINKRLQTNVKPYEDILDLSSNYVFGVGGSYTIGMYVIAPIYIKFEKLKLSRYGRLEYRLKCHKSIELEDLKMSVILSSKSKSVDRFPLSLECAHTNGDFYVMDDRIERNLVDIKEARVYLSYKGDSIRRDWATTMEPFSGEKLQKLEAMGFPEVIPQPKRTSEEVLNRLKHNYESFSNKESFTQFSNIPQKPATYLIYEDSEVIYVGSSIHLRTRLKQLLSGAHVFHNKLKDLFETKEAVQKFVKTNCNFRYRLCRDERDAELLESLCINVYSPKFND